jgi:hypothetical protein
LNVRAHKVDHVLVAQAVAVAAKLADTVVAIAAVAVN